MRTESPELPKKGKPLDYLPGVHPRPERSSKSKSKPPVADEATRPKRGKKVSSEGKLSASAAGEISAAPQEETLELKDEDLLEVEDEAVELSDADVVEEHEEKEYVREEDIVEVKDATPEFPAGMKSSERPLAMEAQELHLAFEDAKADFETTADEVDRRAKEINQELADRHMPLERMLVWSEAISQREGLSQKLDAAMDKMIAARKAYVEASEKLEKKLAKDKEAHAEMEQALDQFVKEHPPTAEPETHEESNWYAAGDKQALDAVRLEIAGGNELDQPVGTPKDLAALGFDQVFIDTYQETQARLEKAEAAKRQAGFMKKLFGGAKLEREYEAARSDFASMTDDVTQRRASHVRAAYDSVMTPAQIEAKRKSDEAKMRGVIGRGH